MVNIGDRWHFTKDVIGKKFSWHKGNRESRSSENGSRGYEE